MKNESLASALKIALVTIGIVFLASALVWAASSVTVTNVDTRDEMKVFKISWVDDNSTSLVTYTKLDNLNGFIYHVITDPGTPAPTDNYDVYIRDYTTGVSMLGTTLENRDTADSELVTPSVPVYVHDIGFSLSGSAVSDAAGDVYLFVAPNGDR